MHILDVTSSVSSSSKWTKVVGGWGFALDLTGGAYSSPSNPLLLRPLPLKGGRGGDEGKRRGDGKGAKMIYAPDARNPRTATASSPPRCDVYLHSRESKVAGRGPLVCCGYGNWYALTHTGLIGRSLLTFLLVFWHNNK